MIRWLFDQHYIQSLNPATRSVPLLYFLYLCAVPLAKILAVSRIRPNTITTLSNLTALAALIALVQGWSIWIFPIAWMLALFLDMADGIVARVTGQSSAQGSFYDHMSDQIKVIALFFCVALSYEDYITWVIAFLVNGLFMFFSVVNHVYSIRELRLNRAAATGFFATSDTLNDDTHITMINRNLIKTFFRNNPALKKMVLGVYASVFVMYGNSMVLLLPVGIGREWAISSMLFFGLVTLRSLIEVMRATIRINQQLAQAKVYWN